MAGDTTRVILSALLMASLASPSLLAEETHAFEVREEGCPDGDTYCFNPPGEKVGRGNVTVLLDNDQGSVGHDLCMEINGTINCASGNGDAVPPGEEAAMTVHLEQPAEYVFWCDEGDHRDRGEEGSLTVPEYNRSEGTTPYEENDKGSIGDGGESPEGEKASPAPGSLLLMVAFLGALLGRSRL